MSREAPDGDSDARVGRHIYVAALPLREKRSGTKFVENLTKYRRFSRGSLRYDAHPRWRMQGGRVRFAALV